jgi:ribonuclease Z
VSFKITILGSGAAQPTFSRNPTSQYIECSSRYFLIDCGEATQLQMRKYSIKFQRISHIFISHLHGDHYFGLVGLLSSMHLLGRNQELFLYGPTELEHIVRVQLEAGGAKLGYTIHFTPLDGKTPCLLFEDKVLEVHTFPLKHRIPTNGFLIKEKQKERTLVADDFAKSGLSLTLIPFFKRGENVEDESGKIYRFDDYTLPAKPAKSYAFCSDTMYYEKLLQYIDGVDLLYHEATFLEKMRARAKSTYHSTARDAATIAQKASVKKLLLGHLSARYKTGEEHLAEAKLVFENVEVVDDGMVFSI